MFRPCIHKLEVDLTYRCPMRCVNCDRFCDIAPSSGLEDMTPEHFSRILDDSIECGHDWEEIRLVGGEPTEHPKFRDFVQIAASYHKRRPRTIFAMYTHGNGAKGASDITWCGGVFPELRIINSKKTSRKQLHWPFCVAPIDVDPHWASTHVWSGCDMSKRCGIGLNALGFHPCAVAGSINRIFGIGKSISSVASLSVEGLQGMYPNYCQLCGFYLQIKCLFPIVSKTWKAALVRYGSTLRDHGSGCQQLSGFHSLDGSKVFNLPSVRSLGDTFNPSTVKGDQVNSVLPFQGSGVVFCGNLSSGDNVLRLISVGIADDECPFQLWSFDSGIGSFQSGLGTVDLGLDGVGFGEVVGFHGTGLGGGEAGEEGFGEAGKLGMVVGIELGFGGGIVIEGGSGGLRLGSIAGSAQGKETSGRNDQDGVVSHESDYPIVAGGGQHACAL